MLLFPLATASTPIPVPAVYARTIGDHLAYDRACFLEGAEGVTQVASPSWSPLLPRRFRLAEQVGIPILGSDAPVYAFTPAATFRVSANAHTCVLEAIETKQHQVQITSTSPFATVVVIETCLGRVLAKNPTDTIELPADLEDCPIWTTDPSIDVSIDEADSPLRVVSPRPSYDVEVYELRLQRSPTGGGHYDRNHTTPAPEAFTG